MLQCKMSINAMSSSLFPTNFNFLKVWMMQAKTNFIKNLELPCFQFPNLILFLEVAFFKH